MEILKWNNLGARGFFGLGAIFGDRLGSGLSYDVSFLGVGGPVWGLGPLEIFFQKCAQPKRGHLRGQFLRISVAQTFGTRWTLFTGSKSDEKGPKKIFEKKTPIFRTKKVPSPFAELLLG
ncbi:hypothetical protein WA026_015697 [Henosepilachna vigintioctopunctata]|uniref:Uncharacterized protein n=1 Tax=Henosepilachna vigintioctopunctata TaxID=420089 RepID=A0AAW1UYG1_9CUCU